MPFLRAPECICNPLFAMAWRTCIARLINPQQCWRRWAVGVMLILTVFLMQHGVIGEMKLTPGPNRPNIFPVDRRAIRYWRVGKHHSSQLQRDIVVDAMLRTRLPGEPAYGAKTLLAFEAIFAESPSVDTFP